MEYRPFFSQGAAYINADSSVRAPVGTNVQAPYLVFYSPSVGPFDSGGKVEGTFDESSFGALTFHGYDATTNNTFTDSAYGFQHAIPGGAFTYWSDGVFANHSIAGWDNTIEDGFEARNLQNGMIYFGDYSFEDGSWVPQGHADLAQFFVDRHKGTLEFNAGYLDVSPNYNPIDGYTANSDIRGPQFFTDYAGATPAIKNYTLFFAADRFTDESGAVHQADVQYFVSAVFKNQFSFDGAGEAVGQLRSYSVPTGPGCTRPILYQSSFTGYPCYLDGVTQPYNLYQVPVGYRDGTPAPIDVNYSWGPFGDDYVHLFTIVTSRPLGRGLSLGLEYDGRTSARSPTASSTRSGYAASRSVTTSAATVRSASNCAISMATAGSRPDRQQSRRRVPPAVCVGQRALRQLRQPGGGRDPRPSDREVRLPRRRRRRNLDRISRTAGA